MHTSDDSIQLINGTPLLIWDILFVIILFPFIVASLHYFSSQSDICLLTTFPDMGVSLQAWLNVDSWILLFVIIHSLLFSFQKCAYPSTRCNYIVFATVYSLFIVWRLAWLIVGSVLFWKHIRPSGLCGGALNGYMWAVLIIGFGHLVAITIFLIVYRPEPLILPPPPPVIPTFTQPVMMTSQALGPTVFRGPGVTIGGGGQAFYY